MSYTRSSDNSANFMLVGGVIILTLSFMIVALILNNALGNGTFSAWGAWFGGTASAAAVVVALRISHRDTSDRDQRERALTRSQNQLFALYMLPRLQEISTLLPRLQKRGEELKEGRGYTPEWFDIPHDFSIKHLFEVTRVDADFIRPVFELDHLLNLYSNKIDMNGQETVSFDLLNELRLDWDRITSKTQEVTRLAVDRSRGAK